MRLSLVLAAALLGVAAGYSVPCWGSRRDLLSSVAAIPLGYCVARPSPAFAAVSPPKVKKKAMPEEYMQGTLTLQQSAESEIIPREAYKKLPSGVVYADVRVGSGRVVGESSRVNLQWILRKGNGYFVDSSEVQGGVPFIMNVKKGDAIQCIDEGVIGMKQGGVRRLICPVNTAYVGGVDDGNPGPLPAGFGPRQQIRRVQGVRKDVPGEFIYLEVQATRVQ